MISDTDIKDWEMLTEPLPIKDLNEGSLFSLFADDKIFKLIVVANDIAFAETESIFNDFKLPSFMKVFQWKQK